MLWTRCDMFFPMWEERGRCTRHNVQYEGTEKREREKKKSIIERFPPLSKQNRCFLRQISWKSRRCDRENLRVMGEVIFKYPPGALNHEENWKIVTQIWNVCDTHKIFFSLLTFPSFQMLRPCGNAATLKFSRKC